MKLNFNKERGFTLIELLIVIAILAILASVAFVALDPLTRFRDARDSSRWSDINSLMTAIKVDQVDNGGNYIYGARFDTSAAALVDGTEYLISNATTTSGCNVTCDATIAASDDCVNLSGLETEGYLGALPVSPNGAETWTSALSGYYLIPNANGSLTIGSCESENASAISITQ